MSVKKTASRFTVQFNPADPQHIQVIEQLNLQGRRKAQFIANAVIHYLNCTETPPTPQPSPLDAAAIEAVVLRILENQDRHDESRRERTARRLSSPSKSEMICCDEAADLLGEDSTAVIADAIAMFRRG